MGHTHSSLLPLNGTHPSLHTYTKIRTLARTHAHTRTRTTEPCKRCQLTFIAERRGLRCQNTQCTVRAGRSRTRGSSSIPGQLSQLPGLRSQTWEKGSTRGPGLPQGKAQEAWDRGQPARSSGAETRASSKGRRVGGRGGDEDSL